MKSAGLWGRITMLLAIVLLFSACDAIRFWEKKEIPVETSTPIEREVMGVRNKATLIQSSIGTLNQRVVPTFSIGDSTLDVSLYSKGGVLRLIDERIRNREGSSIRNRYYFDDSGFFHFYGRGDLRVNPGDDPAEHARMITRMYFNAKGNLFHSEKLINDLTTDLELQEVPRVMRRAFALRSLDWSDSSMAINTVAFLDVLYNADDLPAEQQMMSTYNDNDLSESIADESSAEQTVDVAAETVVEEATPAPAQQQKQPKARTTKPRARKKSQTVKKTVPPPAQSQQQPRYAEIPAAPPPAPVPADEILITAHTHAMLPGTLSSHRIRFQKGNTGATLSASLQKGHHMEYVLRARRGQKMSVAMQAKDEYTYFRVFLNDGDISGQRRSWNGSLPRYGDYHIVVYMRNDAPANSESVYTIYMSIQ